jgi:hypothetical protein
MSGNALSFIGKLDRRDEQMILSQAQEARVVGRLVGRKNPMLAQKLFGQKPVRNVYGPPTRGVDGSCKVMSKN